MKIFKKFKKHYFYIILIISNNLVKCQELYSIDSSQALPITQVEELNQSLVMHFLKQPKYTESSIICFLKHTYNNQYYAEKFLIFNFSHWLTLLSYAGKSSSSKEYIYNIIYLLNQKLSEVFYINSYAFLELLENLNQILKPYFDIEQEKKIKIDLIQKELYKLLTDDFKELKENPETALLKTSNSIHNIFENSQNSRDLHACNIKLELNLLLSNIINKLIWSPKDQIETWQSVKAIAYYLKELSDNSILDTDNLNKFFWYLTTRFSYFLSCSGEFLNPDFYKEIYKDLENKEIFLNLIPEKEFYIKSKIQYFYDMVQKSEIKAYILNQKNISSNTANKQ